jgi:hypothetical protein
MKKLSSRFYEHADERADAKGCRVSELSTGDQSRLCLAGGTDEGPSDVGDDIPAFRSVTVLMATR